MKRLSLSHSLIVASLLLAACGPSITPTTPPPPPQPTTAPAPTATPGPVLAVPDGPVKVSGAFDYSNPIITYYYTQQAVALADMHGFITRDLEWEFPVEGQTLGFLDLDPDAQSGTFFVNLPLKPEGILNDVDNNGAADDGVQVFAVSYWPNLTGGLYSEGDDRSSGWPTYLASVQTDSENKDEVIGGKLVVWAPDDQQQFPTAFGDDGLLFTADDPVGPLAAGYSVIDLDQSPFAIERTAEPEVTLYEPVEAAIKDYTGMSYTESFEALFESVSTNWAFNGIEGKEVDWVALYDRIQPQIASAEEANDPVMFYRALHNFTLAIPDGHTGIGDSQGLGDQDFFAQTEGGFGFAIRELDDGRVITIFLTPGGPAEEAGMEVGAEITEWNGVPIKDAIAAVEPYSGPFSKEIDKRYQQARYLLRTTLELESTVTFTNPGGAAQTATLAAVDERDSLSRTSIYFLAPPTANVPVEWEFLDSGVGYISINSYYDDLSLIITLFERALKQFTDAGVANIIIDLRFNGGGNPLGLAGFLTGEEIPLGQQLSFSEQTGEFEPVGVPEKVLPNEHQYSFEKIAVLVGPACASACDQEAYSFSQVPNAIVVGEYPSGGIFADVLRGQYELPEGISVQIPTERFINADGSLFLEGTGVVPTVVVPITEANALSTDDLVLQAAEDALLGIDPNDVELEGGLRLATIAAAKQAVDAEGDTLETIANETYSAEEMAEFNKTFTYTLDVPGSRERLLWGWGWCATSQTALNQNFNLIDLSFEVNGEVVDPELFYELQQSGGGLFCRSYYALAYNWPSGDTVLTTHVVFTDTINDGTADYAPGQQTFEYTVTAP
jgi:C-terminal processing protease CtpA/Prc